MFANSEEALSLEALRATLADRLKPALDALRRAADPQNDSAIAEGAAPAVIDDVLKARSGAWLSASEGLLVGTVPSCRMPPP